MTRITLRVNRQQVQAEVEPRTSLADFLRGQQNLTGTHLGCEHGVCGACTVLINGVPARSCIAYAVAQDGADVRTVEGFEDDAVMSKLRETFHQEHALQCGYCTPGMLVTARDIVTRLAGADEKRIRVELAGNLCRCTGYQGIVNAIQRAMRELPAESRVAHPAAAPAPAFRTFTARASAPQRSQAPRWRKAGRASPTVSRSRCPRRRYGANSPMSRALPDVCRGPNSGRRTQAIWRANYASPSGRSRRRSLAPRPWSATRPAGPESCAGPAATGAAHPGPRDR